MERSAQNAGFRMLCWEDGEIDFHPCASHQSGLVASGELKVEVAAARSNRFRWHITSALSSIEPRRTSQPPHPRAIHTTISSIETDASLACISM